MTTPAGTPARTADVAVVGAGIIGLATAERLSAQGLSVTVVDGHGPASGATGASGGLVRALDLSTSAALSWAAEGLDRYLRRGPHGLWPEVREHGALTLFGPDDAARAEDAADRVRAAGHTADVLDAKEIATAFPGIAPPEDGFGVHEPRAGWLPARAVAEAVLRDADRVTLLAPARALEITTAGSRVTGVRTTAGFVRARAVLLAAGVHSADLARTAGVELRLRTRSVSYCVFAPRTPVTGALPTVLDTTTGAWLRRWDDGTGILAGAPSTVRDVPPVVTPGVPDAEAERVRGVVRHRCPGLVGAELVGGVTAFDALGPDGGGEVTAWPDPAGLVTATGWNGGGFKKAPAVGRYAAELLREAAS
ncbi:NAD(P)/FAD-dependent oxidoreductase [Streptomyces luteireticuli]|uniref:NAD(P)/FAD-dependent oxidoreductase n=1 Tax=Streptomyces luteireticuli TaxID=173858 RepID=UPI003559304C